MSVGQFAIAPAMQRCSVGSSLIEFSGAASPRWRSVPCRADTSEQALVLIRYYDGRGYRFVEHVQRSVVNYRSVVLAKTL